MLEKLRRFGSRQRADWLARLRAEGTNEADLEQVCRREWQHRNTNNKTANTTLKTPTQKKLFS